MSNPAIRIALLIDPSQAATKQSIDQAARQVEQRFTQAAQKIGTAFNHVATQVQRSMGAIQRVGGGYGGAGYGGYGPGGAAGGGFGPFGSFTNSANQAHRSIGQLSSQIVKLGITLYSIKTISATVYNTLARPWVDLTSQIVKATEASRRFEYATAGVTGGLSRSRELNRALTLYSRNAPLGVQELRGAAESMASKPSLAVRLGMGTTQDQVRQIEQFSSIIGRLQTLFPEQGASGVRAGITNILQGDWQSGRRRFGLSAQLLAQLSGSSLDDLRSDPSRALQGIEKFADLFIPPEAYERISGLVSVRWEKVKDAVGFALQQTGDAGLYDDIAMKMKSISNQMFDYFGSTDFQQDARRMSLDLERTLAAVARSGEKLLNSFTGNSNDLSTVEGAVKSFGNVLDRLAGITEGLPVIIDRLGPSIEGLSSRLGQFFDTLAAISQAMKDPEGYARGTISRTAQTRMGLSANDATMDALKRAGIDTNLVGLSYYDTKTAANQHVLERHRSGEIGGPRAMVESFWAGAQRGAGSNLSAIEELDFRKLPPDQAAMAQKLYMQVRENGQIDPKVFAQLRSVAAGRTFRDTGTLAPRGDENSTESLVRQLIQREYQSPNFQAMLAGTASSSAGIRELADKGMGPIGRLQAAGSVFGRVSLSSDSAVDFGQFLGLIDQQFADAKDILDRAIHEADISGGAAEFGEALVNLRQQRDTLVTRYNTALDLITTQKMEDVAAFGDALGEAISDLPPEAKVEIQRSIMNGVTSAAQQFEGYFGVPQDRRKAYGIESMPIEAQRAFVDANISTNMDAIARMGRLGNLSSLPPNATVQQITSLQPLSDDQVRQRALAFMRGPGMAEASGVLNRAVAEFEANPSETSLANVRAAQVSLADLNATIRDVDLGPLMKQFEELSASLRDGFQGSMSTLFHDIITGTASAEEAFKRFAISLADSWARAMSDMAAQQVTSMMFGQSFGQQDGAIGGIFGGLLGLGGTILGGLFGGPAGATTGGFFGSGTINLTNTLPGRALGGPVGPGWTGVVGERGPELLRMGPNQSGMVIPNHLLGAPGRGAPGGQNEHRPEIKIFNVRNEEEAWQRGYDARKDIVIGDVLRNPHVRQMVHNGG